MPILTPLDVRYVGQGYSELLTDFLYEYEHTKVILVPRGFRTDFASVPRSFRWIITGNDNTKPAAVVHDYLYEINGYGMTRKQADDMFLQIMSEQEPAHLQVPPYKRRIAYAGVRIGGWYPWNRYRKEEKSREKRNG